MSSQEVLDYRIGFEVEGFIKLKRPVPNFRSKYPKEYPNEHFANLVVSTFNNSLSQGQRQLAIRWEKEPGHKPNDKWIVTEDVSLNNKETEKGFHFVIYDFEKKSKWRSEVIDFWKQLLEIGQLSTTNACATHVHISPQNEGNCWSLDQLKQVAQAVIYFEQAFEVIVPESRRGNLYVYRNKANNRHLKVSSFEECCTRIRECSDVDQLVLLIQPRSFPPPEGQTEPPHRSYAWNFINTKKGGIGTIEFRCAPGVLSGEHCLVWVEVAVSFVQAAAQYGTEDTLDKCASDVAGLLKFIRGAPVKDMNKPELMSVVFDGCEGKPPPTIGEIDDLEKPEGENEKDLDEEFRAEFDERIKALPKSLFT